MSSTSSRSFHHQLYNYGNVNKCILYKTLFSFIFVELFLESHNEYVILCVYNIVCSLPFCSSSLVGKSLKKSYDSTTGCIPYLNRWRFCHLKFHFSKQHAITSTNRRRLFHVSQSFNDKHKRLKKKKISTEQQQHRPHTVGWKLGGSGL